MSVALVTTENFRQRQSQLVADRNFRFADEIAARVSVRKAEQREAEERHEKHMFALSMITRTAAIAGGAFLYFKVILPNLMIAANFVTSVLN